QDVVLSHSIAIGRSRSFDLVWENLTTEEREQCASMQTIEQCVSHSRGVSTARWRWPTWPVSVPQGLDVIMVDWNLEAPGLAEFLFEKAEVLEGARGHPGLVDTLLEYVPPPT